MTCVTRHQISENEVPFPTMCKNVLSTDVFERHRFCARRDRHRKSLLSLNTATTVEPVKRYCTCRLTHWLAYCRAMMAADSIPLFNMARKELFVRLGQIISLEINFF